MEYLSKRELCELLKMSIGKINMMIKEGKINYYKIGKLVRFKKDEVVNELKEKYEVV